MMLPRVPVCAQAGSVARLNCSTTTTAIAANDCRAFRESSGKKTSTDLTVGGKGRGGLHDERSSCCGIQRVVQPPVGMVVIMPRPSFADVTSCNGEDVNSPCYSLRHDSSSRPLTPRCTLPLDSRGHGIDPYRVRPDGVLGRRRLHEKHEVRVVGRRGRRGGCGAHHSPGSSSDLIAANQAAAALTCNLTQYKASTGLTTALEGDLLTVSWNGQGTSQLRARFAIDGGTPTIRDLSVRRGSGEWAMLGQNLTPEYQVTTGIRRMSNDQANAFASLGIDITQEVIDKNRWYAFWDAPLSIPGYYPATASGGGGAGAQGAPRRRQTLGQGGTDR